MSTSEKPLLRRDVNAHATRAEILKVARVAFTERGYAAVRLVEIAREAQATTGAIYHHFGGKAELLLAVGELVEKEVVAAIGARVPRDAKPWDAIRAAAAATLDLCSRPEVARIIFKEAPNTLGVIAWREVEMRYGLGGLHALFRRASAASLLHPDDPALIARLVMAALAEGVEAILDDPRKEQRRVATAAIERLLDAFARG